MSHPQVAVAVLASRSDHVTRTLEAVKAQTSPAHAVYVVGEQDTALPDGVASAASVLEVVEHAPTEVTHVWLLHDDASPRPDALGALIREMQRADASVAGSKLLDEDDPDRLESVGGATDVFGYPYTGLQPDEVDQEQYDVVRDVAFVPGASVLVRRDLMRGIRGPDQLLEPSTAEIDFSQRARLAGGRVIVVPSSEVLHSSSCRSEVRRWQTTAGRYRSIAKAYRVFTLAWALPFALVLGLIESAVRTFAGKPFALVDELVAWGWNLVHVPSLISARRSQPRLVGDEELFRYQVGGSAALRVLGADLAERSRRRAQVTGRPVGDWVSRSAALWQTSGFAASIAGLLTLLLAVRQGLLGDLPANGFAMPLLLESNETLRSVAGGWSLAGLGGPLPLHPSVVPQALLGYVVGAETARVLLVIILTALAAAGMWRLAGALGAGAIGRTFAAIGVAAGPSVAAGMAAGYPAVLGGIAPLPLVFSAVINRREPGLRPWIHLVAGVSLGVGLSTVFLPLAPAAVLAVGVVLGLSGMLSLRGLGALGLGSALASLFAAPYLLWVSPEWLVTSHPIFWDAPLWLGGALAAAVVVGLLAVGDERARIVGAGAVLVGLGAVAARSAAAGTGIEVWAVGLAVVALGVGLMAAGLLSPGEQSAGWWGRNLQSLAGLAMVAAIAGTAGPYVWSGTHGLPERNWSETLEFAPARSDVHGLDRTLIIGGDPPGSDRIVLGTRYRVVNQAGLEEAWLDGFRPGDRQLEDDLIQLYDEVVVRPGEILAGYGIRWVVIEGETPFGDTFESVLDMKRLPIADATVFENLEPSPIASTASGVAWSPEGLGFSGPPAASLNVRSNAADGWGAMPAGDGWSMSLDASSGAVTYDAPAAISQAGRVSLGALLVLLVVRLGTRRRE